MISEAQRAPSSTNDGRTGQRRKYEIMRKSIKSYRQVFESLATRISEMGQSGVGE
jgi:hypothetical protein